MTAAVAQPAEAGTLVEFARGFPEWLKKNVPTAIVSAAISGVIGYLINAWLMAVRYEGSATPAGAPVTSKDNLVSGGLFWALLPMVVMSMVSYRRRVGKERFWRDIRSLPNVLVSLFQSDGDSGRVHLLSGAAIALAASFVVSPAAGAVLGLGLLVAVPSLLGGMIAGLVSQVWYRIAGRVLPAKQHAVPPVVSSTVGLLGAAGALVIGFLLPGRTFRLLLALVCAGLAIYISQRGKAAGAAALVLLVAGAYAVADVVFASPALADDGGFAECGSTLADWIQRCPGADEVRRLAGQGGIIAAIFGPLGAFIGDALAGTGGLPPGGGGAPPSGNGRGAGPGGRSGLINPDTGEDHLQRQKEYHDRRWDELVRTKTFDDRVKQLQGEEREWNRKKEDQDKAKTTLDNIKDIARRHGFDDILERAEGSNVLGPDGKPDPGYINKLREILKKDLGIEKAMPPEVDWVMDGLTETGKDLIKVGKSIPVRIAVGIATGGSSEVVYGAVAAGDAMLDATDKAIKNGKKDMDWSDFVREGLISFGEENLPVNTIKNLKDGKTDIWSITTGLAGDAFSIMNIGDTGKSIGKTLDNIPNVKSRGDLLDALHKGDDLAKRAAIEGFDGSKGSFKNAPDGTPVPPDRLKDFGISGNEFKDAVDAAKKTDANLQVRPAAKEGIALREQGHPPKPEFIKNKTINDADTYLGARLEDKGLVGAFPPKLPDPDVLATQVKARNSDLTPAQVEVKVKEIEARATQRFDEYADQKAKLDHLVEEGAVKIENGVIIDNRVTSGGQGKGFTADLDMYDAVNANGTRTSLDTRWDARWDLHNGPFDVQHGFHKDWVPVGSTNIEIDARIRASHGPGGEGLLEIRPDGTAVVRYDDSYVREMQNLQTGVSVTAAAGAETAFGDSTSPAPTQGTR
jgi:hypothetical protein